MRSVLLSLMAALAVAIMAFCVLGLIGFEVLVHSVESQNSGDPSAGAGIPALLVFSAPLSLPVLGILSAIPGVMTYRRMRRKTAVSRP